MIDGLKPGYTSVTLVDQKTGTKTTYNISKGKVLEFNNKRYDLDKYKDKGLTLYSGNDELFYLLGLSLKHMDVNKDGCIDDKDTDTKSWWNINRDINPKKTQYYIRYEDYSRIEKGEASLSFQNEDFKYFNVDLHKKK